jgi:ABC-type uncharacterized transport system YnjBCD ATPase subunit
VEVNQGEIVGLLGPNGAGKPLFIWLWDWWNQIQKHLSWWYEHNWLSYVQEAQHGIGYLAQEASVFRKLSIEDNILSVLQLTIFKRRTRSQNGKLDWRIWLTTHSHKPRFAFGWWATSYWNSTLFGYRPNLSCSTSRLLSTLLLLKTYNEL